MMVLTGVVIVVNIKVLLFSNTFYFLNLFFLIGSVLVYVLFIGVDSVVWLPSISTNLYGEFANAWKAPNFYLGLVLMVVATNFIDWASVNYDMLLLEARNKLSNSDDFELQTLIGTKIEQSPSHHEDEPRSNIIGESGDADTIELSKTFKKPSQQPC